MKFIVAADARWGIGKDGGLLAHFSKDLAFFKQMTTGHVVVMGRKTLESFPGGRPLPNRLHIILTRDAQYHAPEGVIVVHSIGALAEKLAALGREDVFLIGGASLYGALVDACDEGYVTHIDHVYEEADVHFPNLDFKDNWQFSDTLQTAEDHGVSLRFCHYINRAPRALEDNHHE